MNSEMEDELQPDYDFTQLEGGIKGKYVDRYRSGTNLVLLDPDVAKSFPNESAVNVEHLQQIILIGQAPDSPTGEATPTIY